MTNSSDSNNSDSDGSDSDYDSMAQCNSNTNVGTEIGSGTIGTEIFNIFKICMTIASRRPR